MIASFRDSKEVSPSSEYSAWWKQPVASKPTVVDARVVCAKFFGAHTSFHPFRKGGMNSVPLNVEAFSTPRTSEAKIRLPILNLASFLSASPGGVVNDGTGCMAMRVLRILV